MNLKFIPLIFQYADEFFLALEILRLTKKTVDSIQFGEPNVGEVSRRVFRLLPAKFKEPKGTISEIEMIDAVHKGATFYLALKALFEKKRV